MVAAGTLLCACGDVNETKSGISENARSFVLEEDGGEHTIELITTDVLSSDSVDPFGAVVKLSTGEFITGTYEKGVLAVWSQQGALVRRIGRDGKGPNEMSGLIELFHADLADSLHVLDGTGRWTVISPELNIVRQKGSGAGYVFLHPRGTLFLPDGRILVSHPLPFFPASAAFFLVDHDGNIIGSFGDPFELTGDSTVDRSQLARVVADAGDRQIWAATRYPYRLELWSTGGRRLEILARNVRWLEPHRDAAGHDRKLIAPGITSLYADSAGLLWVGMLVYDSRGEIPSSFDEGLTHEDRYYDYRLEVIDPVRRRVVASRTFDTISHGLLHYSRDGTSMRLVANGAGQNQVEFVTRHILPRK